MYLYNEFIMKFKDDIKTMLYPIIFKSNTILLTMNTSCYLGLGLTLCLFEANIICWLVGVSKICWKGKKQS